MLRNLWKTWQWLRNRQDLYWYCDVIGTHHGNYDEWTFERAGLSFERREFRR